MDFHVPKLGRKQELLAVLRFWHHTLVMGLVLEIVALLKIADGDILFIGCMKMI